MFNIHYCPVIQIHERRCGWMHVVDNHLFALQGKTPYLYQHNILQLVQQQMITQRISKTMTRIPEKLKPRVLLATVRQPETKYAAFLLPQTCFALRSLTCR